MMEFIGTIREWCERELECGVVGAKSSRRKQKR